MKIAYIVQCHKNAGQINLLINQLSDGDNDIYLHIDQKSGDFGKNIIRRDNVFILPDDKRVTVKWGQISQVDATLNLIESVLQSGKQYDYVWLISGQDLPIKSNKEISDYLSSSDKSAFLELLPTSGKRYKRLLKRNEVWTAQWSVKKGIFMRIVRNVWYLLTGGRYHTFKIFKRKYKSDVFYFGSSWWCLPYDAIKEMKDYLDANDGYYKFYSHCHCPDESFFQTLFMNHTGFSNSVKPILTYIDWEGCKDSPRTLTAEDYEKLASSDNYLFARKFDINVDKEIIVLICEKINE